MSKTVEYKVPGGDKVPCEGRLKSYHKYGDHYQQRREKSLGVTGPQCGMGASIKVDGVWYCGKHAGRAALEYLVKMEGKP